MLKVVSVCIFMLLLVSTGVFVFRNGNPTTISLFSGSSDTEGDMDTSPHPLSIEALQQGEYPGSDIVIEQTLTDGGNYKRFIASYKSEGLKQFGLLTIPMTTAPQGGFPIIMFNHGYIAPSDYKTTEKYVAYQDAFAKNGYITFKPDYRGHGNSEGEASGGYGTNDYTIDVLNALASVKKLGQANPDKVGVWGHSMGGHIALESIVVDPSIKAAVIWAGVVGSYEDLFYSWRRSASPSPSPNPSGRGRWRAELTAQFGNPKANPAFWNSLSATSYLNEIGAAVQLHHGSADSSVPIEFSRTLKDKLSATGKTVELYEYAGDDHNLSANLTLALARSVAFFDTYLAK